MLISTWLTSASSLTHAEFKGWHGCPQDHGTERRHYDVLVSRAGHPTLDSDRCCLDTMFQVSRASQAQPYQG
jgi:hypothetical protein